MSLFASLGQGDIWALSGISFVSPVNDLLDKGEFTLEELLEEDELIQEVKSKNDRLIEFLSKESTINQLLDFIIMPAEVSDSEKRIYKYPYMSCEVICCEISEILKVLVEDQNGRYLHKLFTFLSVNSKLDCYLAGYFEKILEMLFRNMTVLMMKFFNSSGLELLKLFLNHIDNYSIMQIVQRLMLPHIPFSNSPEMENISYEDMKDFYQCNWSYMVEACSLLFNRMFETDNAEIPLHISDLLITVLQLSPPETLVIKFLCQDECINKLLDFIVADHADMVVVGDPFISSASISLASISVLESLISRLFEASLPFESNGRDTEFEVEHAIRVKESIDSICSQIIHFIPKINSALRLYIDDNPCAQLFSQNKIFFNRLGHRGLQLIKLIESLNRLANAYVDNTFCENGIFKTCIDLFVLFEGNSLLHLSVQRILITIIEADNSRRTAQKNVLVDCDLFRIVMSKVKRSRGTEDVSPPPESDTGDHAKDETARTKIYSNHSSMIGNMILIAQALSVAFDSNANDSSSHHSEDAIGADIQEERESDIKPTDANAPKSLTSNWEKQIDESEQNDDKMGLDQVTADLETIKIYATTDLQTEQINTADTKPNTESEDLDPNSLRALVVDEDLISSWENFVEKTLRPILDHQIMGSYQPSNVLSNSPMQDDPMKFGVDLDAYQLGGMAGKSSQFDDDDEDDEDDNDDHDFGIKTNSRFNGANWDYFQGMNTPKENAGRVMATSDLALDATVDFSEGGFAQFADFALFDSANSDFANSTSNEVNDFADFSDVDFTSYFSADQAANANSTDSNFPDAAESSENSKVTVDNETDFFSA